MARGSRARSHEIIALTHSGVRLDFLDPRITQISLESQVIDLNRLPSACWSGMRDTQDLRVS